MISITKIQDIIFKSPMVENDIKSLKKIKEERCSVSRFGDGEMALVNQQNIKFQKHDELLARRLEEVLESNEKDMLICIPNIFRVDSLKYLTYESKVFWLNELIKNRKIWYNVPKKDKLYYDACITRPYIRSKDKQHSKEIFELLKEIWKERDVVIIEGAHSRLGVGNDLFNNTNSLHRVLCPPKDAFKKYDEILQYVIEYVKKDRLLLISLGPTATVMAYDLHRSGYQAIDLGHIDLEYEWFLKNAKERIMIKNKAVNELAEEALIQECRDEKYQREILVEIK